MFTNWLNNTYIFTHKGMFTNWLNNTYIFMHKGMFTNWLNNTYICCMSCHATYTFQSESTFYNCLNVKELLARSRYKV